MLKAKRTIRVRNKIRAVSSRPRLCIFKSNRYFSAQLIDDAKQITLLGVHEKSVSGKTKADRLTALATELAKKMKSAKQTVITFDRGGNRYHGIVAAFAEALRKEGITF